MNINGGSIEIPINANEPVEGPNSYSATSLDRDESENFDIDDEATSLVSLARDENTLNGIEKFAEIISDNFRPSKLPPRPIKAVLRRINEKRADHKRLPKGGQDGMDERISKFIDHPLTEILNSFVNISKAQNIHMKKTGIQFKDLSVFANNDLTSKFRDIEIFDNVFDAIWRSVSFPYHSIRNSYRKKSIPEEMLLKTIIHNCSGFVESGEMLLLLGRPGSGCSSFLKSLAGQTTEYAKVKGDIFYDGLPQERMMKRFPGDVLYVPETDDSFPYLTVKQTLEFAISCRAPRLRPHNVSRDQFVAAYRDVIASFLSLRHTYDTIIGNDFIKGISGGERKRVAIAEAIAARASVYCWDNATRGLDSGTALEYSKSIRAITSILGYTSIVALYQASESIFNLFDKVAVMYDGRLVYFGPIDKASEYFTSMGYYKKPRQSTAEFLIEVTDPTGRFVDESLPQSVISTIPQTAIEFEQRWHSSQLYAELMGNLDKKVENSQFAGEQTEQNFRRAYKDEKMKVAPARSKFNTTFYHQMNLLTKRALQRVWGDKTYSISLIIASVVEALIMGSLFYNMQSTTAGAFSKGGLLYFAILFYLLSALADMTVVFESRAIIERQRCYCFYRPGIEVLAQFISTMPVKLLAITCFTIIIYFLSNLKVDVGAFFTFYLFIIISSGTMNMVFGTVAALSPSDAAAHSVAGILLLAITIYTGYLLQEKSMHPWFRYWIFYINPIRYGFETLMANEFHGVELECSNMVPRGPGYEDVSPLNQVCAFTGATLGSSVVQGDAYVAKNYNYDFNHVWRNFGILIAFWIFFLATNILATEYGSTFRTKFGIGAKKGDRLLFLKGTIPNEFYNENKQSTDEESKNSTESEHHNDSEDKNEKFGTTKLGSETFTWRQLEYTIQLGKNEDRKLLDRISGYIKPGTMTALVGESGAGKTTLLNVLSNRIRMGIVGGSIFVGNEEADRDVAFRRRTGYVQQQDLHISELTVKESLLFSARLRQPQSVPDAEKVTYIDELIKVLNMEAYENAIVGAPGAGLNVEQRKKLSIGVELAAKPDLLLFLDEPTSGLDSQSAGSIVRFLRRLALSGQAILCTIHQPSATLFEQFDNLLLLKRGGRTVYFGPIGNSSCHLLDYFERHGGRHCEISENPAEYVLEVIGAGLPGAETGGEQVDEETSAIIKDWGVTWEASEEAAALEKDIDEILSTVSASKFDDPRLAAEYTHQYATSWFYQLWEVWIRSNKHFFRDPDYVLHKLRLLIISGLFLGFTFWDIKPSLTGMQNALFAIFSCLVLSIAVIVQVHTKALVSREIYEVRESESNTFHWTVMILSQNLVECFYNTVGATFTFFCFYFPLKVNDNADIAGFFWLNYAINYEIYIITLGLGVLYFSHDRPTAAIINVVLFSIMIGFCGVMQPRYEMVKGIYRDFMYRVSPFTYFIEAFVGTVLHDREVVCAQDEIAFFEVPQNTTCGAYTQNFFEAGNVGYIMNPENSTGFCEYCLYKVGDQYLNSVNIDYSNRWRDFGISWLYIAFNIFIMFFLYYFLRHKVYKRSLKWHLANWRRNLISRFFSK